MRFYLPCFWKLVWSRQKNLFVRPLFDALLELIIT